MMQIDQSGKIEQTHQDTILCLSNGDWFAVKVSATTKRQLQEIFRRNGQIRNYILFTFAAGIALLLKLNPKVRSVTIDQEYLGKEPIIKQLVLSMLETPKREGPAIHFGFVGKSALAHHRAYAIATRK